MIKRKSLILCLLLSLLLVLIACSSIDDYTNPAPDDSVSNYALTVDLELPAIFSEVSAASKTIEEYITIKELKVKIYEEEGGQLITEGTLDDPLNETQIVFDNLEAGKHYQIKAELIGTLAGLDQRVLCVGSAISPKLERDAVNRANLSVEPLSVQSLKVNEIIIKDLEGRDLEIEVDEITLMLDDDNQITKDYDPGVIFEDGEELNLIPSHWELKVKIDQQWYGVELLLLPTEEREIDLELTIDLDQSGEAGIEIGIDIITSPSAPTNLRIENNKLIWDADGAYYKVYKSETEQAEERGISEATLMDNSYADLEVGYYYWLRAFDENNRSSSLSGPVKAKVVDLLEMETVVAGTSSDYLELDDLALDYDLEVAKYQVTNAEYLEFLNSVGVAEDGSYEGKQMMDVTGGNFQFTYYNDQFHLKYWTDADGNRLDIRDYPVVYVTWYGAVAYTNWLSEEAGLEPAYDLNSWELKADQENLEGYRLATEDEWEYAARGGADGAETIYPGSDNLDDVAWHAGNSAVAGSSNFQSSGGGTHPVGLKAPNELGLYDMSGNARDWTNTPSSDTHMVTRGAAFSSSSNLEVNRRWSVSLSSAFFNNSFRSVRTSR